MVAGARAPGRGSLSGVIAPQQALALRRFLLVVSGLTATLAAHAACAGGLSLTPTAPLVWGSLGCLAVVAGSRRRAAWREWSAPGLATRLMAVEMAFHAGLTAAPWAFGVTAHHTPALVSPATLLAHGAAALALALALMGAQRVLSAAQRVVRALRRALRVAVTGAPPRLMAHPRVARALPSVARRPRSARGPPVPAV